MSDEKPKLYHEKQRLQLCALHSLNSLFQKNLFNKKNLDTIVSKYDTSWCWNEYSSFYTGNYDLTILLDALEQHDYTLRAIDNKESFEQFDFSDCLGLLLNIPLKDHFLSRLPFIRLLNKPGRHWLTIKYIQDEEKYYDFDSKFSLPKLIGNQTQLIEYLKIYPRSETYMYIVIHKSKIEKYAP